MTFLTIPGYRPGCLLLSFCQFLTRVFSKLSSLPSHFFFVILWSSRWDSIGEKGCSNTNTETSLICFSPIVLERRGLRVVSRLLNSYFLVAGADFQWLRKRNSHANTRYTIIATGLLGGRFDSDFINGIERIPQRNHIAIRRNT